MSSNILVFAENIMPRVRYIFTLLLEDRLGIKTSFTDNNAQFEEQIAAKLSYAKNAISDELHFDCHPLLFETGIRSVETTVTKANGIVHLFEFSEQRGALSFDPFAAAFFLLTRYEEYLPSKTDEFGRFDATESIAFHNGFLSEPVVDHWTLLIKDILQTRFPELEFKKSEYSFTSTIDVDNAFAYSNKGIWRSIGGLGKSIIARNWNDITARIRTLIGAIPDPYDTYTYLQQAHQNANATAIYFFLLGNRGAYDKNVAHTNAALRKLIEQLDKSAQVGIHPSFQSNHDTALVALEKLRLEEIVSAPITRSRQHFIMLSLPSTYQNLVKCGIKEDYSMGYATHLGFRASTAIPYLHYDLSSEECTALRIFPFACMDGTFKHYLKQTPQQSMLEIERLVEGVRKVDGHFIAIWHNETVRNTGEWRDWRQAFEHTLKVAKSTKKH